MKELVITIFELAHAYKLYKQPTKIGINIDFDDGVFQSQDAKAEYYGKLSTMQLTSKLRAIQKVLGVTEKEAKIIMQEIKSEELGLDYAENVEEHIQKELGSDE